MSNIYRIFPVLWNDGICKTAQNVYAVDRAPPPATFPTTCSGRIREDPAYYYDCATFQRLLPPPAGACGGGCYQPPLLNAVNWFMLPAWLSYVATLGFTPLGDWTSVKPNGEFYIQGP